jgi:hypothetical protein
MPAVSRKQQKYLYAKFGSAWVHAHHFDKVAGKSPASRKPRSK